MRFNEGVQIEEVETCLLCGAKGVPVYKEMRDHLFNAPGVWSHLRCPGDNHVWLSPRPVIEDIAKVYKTYYTQNLANSQQSILASLKGKVERTLLKANFGYEDLPGRQESRLLGRVVGLLPMAREIAGSSVMWLNAHPKGKLLDVGCGNGNFIVMMQKLGWDVLGVEPDAKAAMIAKKRLGALVTIGTLADAAPMADSFDAVTAHHVIEHMHDPIGFLRESLRALKAGGTLVVTTPNIASLGHRVLRKSWRGLEPPRHLHLFSTCTLGACAEQVGYQVQTLRTTARSAWEIWCASRLIHRHGGIRGGFPQALGQSLRLEGLVFQLLEHMMLRVKDNIGEAIVLIASKSRRQ